MSLAGSTTSLTTPLTRVPSKRGLWSLYADLTKARLSSLVVFTTAAGFVVASGPAIDWWRLLWTAVGTAIAAASASAFNQIVERSRDGLMHRTRNRPLPAAQMSVRHAFVLAMILAYCGVAILLVFTTVLAAGLALLTIVLYIFAYTPLKTRTTLNTLVGAVCGAIPPMIGWAAAAGSLNEGAWLLGAVLFIWQLPHFFALAWMYREDYQRGGFRMLPVVDSTGRLTANTTVLTSLALVPLGWLFFAANTAGVFFAISAILLSIAMVILAIGFAQHRNRARARLLFLGSIIYLPLFLVFLMADRSVHLDLPSIGTEIHLLQKVSLAKTP